MTEIKRENNTYTMFEDGVELDTKDAGQTLKDMLPKQTSEEGKALVKILYWSITGQPME